MAPRGIQCLLITLLFLVTVRAQTVVLTPSTTVLSSAGGNVTFTATLSYTTLPSTLGLTITLPTGWSYVSGTTVGGTSPAEPVIAPSAGRTGQLEWAFITPPPSPVTFTFTTSYPGTGTGLQALTPSTIARDGTGGTPATATAPTYNLSAPSTIISWNGGTGNWADTAQWNPATVPQNAGATRFSATVAAGIASLNTAVTIDNLTFTGGTINGAGSLTLAGLGSTWTAGIFGGLGELIIAPGAQLTAAGDATHAFSERTIRNQGTFVWADRGMLQSGSGGAFINTVGSTFTDATSGVVDYRIASTGTGTFTFSNAGTYQKTNASSTRIEVPFFNTGNIHVNAGTLRFTNTFTQTGGALNVATGATIAFDNALNFSTGTLQGGGTVLANVTNGGTISPGNSYGTLTIDGNLTLLGTSMLIIDIGGSIQGTNYDHLFVRGNATLDGSFAYNMATGAEGTLNSGHTLTLLSATAVSGTFANLPNGTRLFPASGVGSFIINYNATSVTLSGFIPIPEPSTWVLLFAGTGALALASRRRR